MNWLFRRHFWIVHAVFLCIVAIVSAKTFTTLAGYWVSKHIPEKPSAKIFEEPEPEIVPKNFALASERNLFNAKREHISFANEEEEETEPGRWQDALLSSLPLKLVSTMVFFDPFDSRTVIQNMSAGGARVYSIEDCREYRKNYDEMKIETVLPARDWQPDRPCNSIDGIATVKRIEEFRVYIFNERDRRYEYLSLLPEGKRMRQRAMVEEFAPVEGEGVRKVGPTSYGDRSK